MNRRPMNRRPLQDRGSATLWVLAAVLALSSFAALVLASALVAVDRHRAATVADLAALAAAAHSLDGPAAACDRASLVARAARARLVDCRLDGAGTVLLTVEMQPAGPLAGLPPLRVTARAGPTTAR
jgi:secretion/DNA translocation related TadE-like protein